MPTPQERECVINPAPKSKMESLFKFFLFSIIILVFAFTINCSSTKNNRPDVNNDRTELLNTERWQAGDEEIQRKISYLSALQKLKIQDAVQWRRELTELKTLATNYVSVADNEELNTKLNTKESDVIMITLMWPAVLKDKVESAAIYNDCASLHENLVNTFTKTALSDWTACVENGYGRDKLPKIYLRLRANYEQLKLQ